MSIKEGVIPAALGTAVTAVGTAMVTKKIAPEISAGVVGFGLAHIVLGSIDLAQNRHRRHWYNNLG